MATYFWVGGTGTWSGTGNTQFAITSGGVATLLDPTSADTVNFDANSGTSAVVTVASTAASGPVTLNKSDLTLSLSGNVTLASTSTFSFTFTSGTITLNNFKLTTRALSTSGSASRVINFGSGSIDITGNGTNVFNFSTNTNFSFSGTSNVNLTYAGGTGQRNVTLSATETNALNISVTAGSDIVFFTNGSAVRNLNFTGFAGTGTIGNGTFSSFGNLTISSGMTVTSARITFAGTSGTQQITTASKTFDFPLVFNGVGGTFAFQDALTQGSTKAFTITNGTVQLKAGVTSTVGSFVANSATTKSLQSTTPGSQATISQASGTVTVADLTIRDSNAAGGASWTAYADYENTDAGNNDGWDFGLSPPYASYEPPIIIRSFTQPRRF